MADRTTLTDAANNLQKMAEGRLSRSTLDNPVSPTSTFIRMIVMDVIVDPNVDLSDSEKINGWHAMGVSNMKYASILPRNTIVAKRVGEQVDPMFVFPFFPSHLSLPCKPGECVWAMLEKPEVPNSDMAFWFSRVIEPHVSDDVNHSHPGRSYEITLSPTTKERADNERAGTAESGENVFHELRNGPVVKKGTKRVTAGEAQILQGEDEDIFERLLIDSKAAEYMTYEAVPRFRKRPGDVALEGTNNTLIVLGTDRVGELKKTKHETGAIDMVVGRGQTKETFGVEAKTTSITKSRGQDKGGELKKELNKALDVLVPKEGDPDFVNDRSRILLSQSTEVDKNFKLDSYNKDLGISDDAENGDAGIVIKSDKIRLIARSDVEIVVTGFKSKLGEAPNKKKYKDEEGPENWASITINSKGEIVIKPSKDGVIKLGSEKANKAILCTPSVNSGAGGQVVGKPIATTMGGQVGLAPGSPTGEWAKKVLID